MRFISLLLLLPFLQQNDPTVSYLKPLYLSCQETSCFRAARYPAGETALSRFFREQAVYPEQARLNAIEGEVWVQFWVSPDGILQHAQVFSSPGFGLDTETLRLLALIKKWEPATLSGKAVSSRVQLMVRFSLE